MPNYCFGYKNACCFEISSCDKGGEDKYRVALHGGANKIKTTNGPLHQYHATCDQLLIDLAQLLQKAIFHRKSLINLERFLNI